MSTVVPYNEILLFATSLYSSIQTYAPAGCCWLFTKPSHFLVQSFCFKYQLAILVIHAKIRLVAAFQRIKDKDDRYAIVIRRKC